jgi:predicted solute-binding protein
LRVEVMHTNDTPTPLSSIYIPRNVRRGVVGNLHKKMHNSIVYLGKNRKKSKQSSVFEQVNSGIFI